MATTSKAAAVRVSELSVGDRVRFRTSANESWRSGSVSYVPDRLSSGSGCQVRVRTDEVQPDGFDKATLHSKSRIERI